MTQIVFDPRDSNAVWAGVEIDGAWRSTDGGRPWERRSADMDSQDIHGFAVVHNGERVLYATTNAGMHESRDNGESSTALPRRLGEIRALAWLPD